MIRGAFFHEFGHDHDHAGLDASEIRFFDPHGEVEEDAGGAGPDDMRSLAWSYDNVELTTVGVDVGSSTSHLLFARLHLQRLSQSLSSRFAVVKREVLHRSPILLTPYRADGLIDIEGLERFFDDAYQGAGLRPDEIDTGAVILTGAALERANARAVAEVFASAGGKFVCASAGHNLEALLAAHGSGASALSHKRGDTILHVDVGGGTSKLSLIRDGDVLATSAVGVGGRLIAFDEEGRVTRIEHAARSIASRLGIDLELGARLSDDERLQIAQMLAAVLLEVMRGEDLSELAQELMLTETLQAVTGEFAPDAISFSGGVSEYIYQREPSSYGDIAADLASALLKAGEAGAFTAPVVSLGEGIRATVIGASQFSVQLSGNTVHISNPDVLPLRNLPVVYSRLPEGSLDEDQVASAIGQAFRRLDLVEGDQPVALAIPWKGEPFYTTLRALAGGIARAMPRSLRAEWPLVIALDGDVGRSVGGILAEEFDIQTDIVSIDGLQLLELDYVDVGEVIQPANVVPVVVKSLAFPAPAATREAAQVVAPELVLRP